MHLCYLLNQIKWLAFGRGIGGCPQQAVFVVTEWAIANDVASKYDACQTYLEHLCRENILRKKGEYDSHFSGDWCRF